MSSFKIPIVQGLVQESVLFDFSKYSNYSQYCSNALNNPRCLKPETLQRGEPMLTIVEPSLELNQICKLNTR